MSTAAVDATTRTLLLVEDEALIALSEKATLERAGYAVRTAKSGEAALELAFSDAGIDLVLMDIDLGPGIDGTEAAERILEVRNLPIVFLSSHTEPDIVRKTEGITSYGYVVKDSGDTVLLAAIRMAFRLSESHRLIEDTFTYSMHGVCVHRFLYDDEGTPFDCEYLRVNEAFERQTGLSEEAVNGRTIRDIYPGNEAVPVIELYSDILAGTATPRQTLYFEPSDSWFDISVFATRADEFTVIVNNVTQQTNAKAALAESEARYRLLYETIPQGVVHQTRDGTIVSANPAAERILGLNFDQMQGRSSLDPRWHMADEDGNRIDGPEHPAMVALRTGRTVGPVVRSVFRPETDSTVWLRITAVPLFQNNEQTPYQVYATFEDITEQRQSELRYQSLIEHLPGITYSFSSTKGGLFWSRQIRSILGYEPAQVRSDPFLWNRAIHPDDRQMVQSAIDSHEAGAEYSVEYRIQTADGRWIWFHDRFVRKTQHGAEAIIDGFAIDITRRKRSELENAELLLEKETLLREMRHRIKNNMSTVISLLSLQIDSVRDDAAVAILKDTMSRLTGLQLLFDQLHSSTAHAGVSIPEYLNTLVSHTMRLFPYGDRVRIDGSLEDCLYDVKQLSALGLIVNELLTNAMKYAFHDNPDPRLTVSGTNHGDRYVLVVADNGPGMEEAPDTPDSSGLGMTIVNALCEQIDARIAFENETGVRVRIEFPVT